MGSTALRFGLVDHVELSDTALMGDVLTGHIEYVRAADEAGIWGYHTTEHHLSTLDATPSPSLLLAALAPLTTNIKLGSLVHIITAYNPIRLAQEVIMLDHLSNGRLQLGVGKGVSPPEHRVLGLVTDEIAELFDRNLESMVAVLEGDPVAGAPIPFSAVQEPYPPIWYAGNAARAAELNLNAIVGGGPQAVAAQHEEHRRIRAENRNHRPYNPSVEHTTVGATRQVFIAPDTNTARERAIAAWKTYTRHINHHFWRTGEATPRDPTFGGDAEAALAANALVAGSPAQVAESYAELAEVGGIDYLLGAFYWGDLEHSEAMRSFELFVTEVIPAVTADQ